MEPRRFRESRPDSVSEDWLVDQSIVDCAWFLGGRRAGGRLAVSEVADRARADDDGFAWVGLYNPSEQQLALLARLFDLHPLAVEDALHAHQRPKLERYDDMLFLVLKTVRLNAMPSGTAVLRRSPAEQPRHRPGSRTVMRVDLPPDIEESGELMVFLGERFVITVRHGEAVPLEAVRRRLEERPDIGSLGPLGVGYAIADVVVDRYLAALVEFEERIEDLEDLVFGRRGADVEAQRLYVAKRSAVTMRRVVLPLLRPLDLWTTSRNQALPPELERYFRDVYDHLQRVADEVTGLDEALTALLAAHMARTRVRANDQARRISSWAAIIAVPTLIGGVYGMNFVEMPLLANPYGFALVVLSMLLICGLMFRGFRRSGWL